VSLLGALANLAGPTTRDDEPPVPYTMPGDTGVPLFGAGPGSLSSQLDLTTAETVLFSVLDLISEQVSSTPWWGQRPEPPGREQDTEPVMVTAEESLAVKLWDTPNSYMTREHVMKMMTWHYAAVGEGWAVMRYADKARTIPVSWWPVRPDRMFPIPSPDKYLVGYMYVGPNQEKIPLELNQVLRLTNPHPTDAHRGIGVVQTLGRAVDLAMTSQQWISAFFRNDATPGGIIEIPDGLEDEEYRKLVKRWNDQHRGVNRAHRVAILEYGKFTPRGTSPKDMEFKELRTLSRDQILEGVRVHRHMLGASDDVNLANAQAAQQSFDSTKTEPYLRKWKGFADRVFRPKFGQPGTLVELCYRSPIKEDAAEERADTTSRVDNAVKLIALDRFDDTEVLEAFGLPALSPKASPEPDPAAAAAVPVPDSGNQKLLDAALAAQKIYLATDGNTFLAKLESRKWAEMMGAPIVADDYVEPEPAPAPALPVPVPPPAGAAPPNTAPTSEEGAPAEEGTPPGNRTRRTSLAAHRVQALDSPAADVDLSQLDSDWQTAVEAALARWQSEVLPGQYTALVDAVRAAVDAEDYDALAALTAPTGDAEQVLTDAMTAMAALGAASVVREAAAQGVTVEAVTPPDEDMARYARVAVAVVAAALAGSAAAEALRLVIPNAVGSVVANLVRQHLESLALPALAVGAALTVAQNRGRLATMSDAPAAEYYASEVLDTNTCAPCRDINGARLGDSVTDVFRDYPTGGYIDCLGRARCRGTVVAVWEGGSDA
jgi:HK97 family phage portal protein